MNPAISRLPFAPSDRTGEMMAQLANVGSAPSILVLGVGSGSIVQHVLQNRKSGSIAYFVDPNERIVGQLRSAIPQTRDFAIVNSGFEEFLSAMSSRKPRSTFALMSNVSLLAIGGTEAARLVYLAGQCMAPGGTSAWFQTTPMMKPILQKAFGEIETVGSVPSIVYVAKHGQPYGVPACGCKKKTQGR